VKKAKASGESGSSGANALPGNEPSWLLSQMKFVKVWSFTRGQLHDFIYIFAENFGEIIGVFLLKLL
jgi:hypothetical protein